jgi:hypothetical protein
MEKEIVKCQLCGWGNVPSKCVTISYDSERFQPKEKRKGLPKITTEHCCPKCHTQQGEKINDVQECHWCNDMKKLGENLA